MRDAALQVGPVAHDLAGRDPADHLTALDERRDDRARAGVERQRFHAVVADYQLRAVAGQRRDAPFPCSTINTYG